MKKIYIFFLYHVLHGQVLEAVASAKYFGVDISNGLLRNTITLKNITPTSKKFSENWLLHVIIFLTVSVLPSNWFMQ